MARPSTGCIGNLGLISTARHMDGQTPGNVEVRCVRVIYLSSVYLGEPQSLVDTTEMSARAFFRRAYSRQASAVACVEIQGQQHVCMISKIYIKILLKMGC